MLTRVYAALFIILLASRTAIALSITTPTSGTSVAQGGTLTVHVVNTNSGVTQVLLAGSLVSVAGLSITSTLQTAQSAMDFTVPIPQTMKPGTYRLAVLDATSAQTLQNTTNMAGPVTVVVVPSVAITALSLQPTPITLRYVGDRASVRVIGTGSGLYAELTESPGVTFQSSDASVATVDSAGRVTGIGAGTATITARYNSLTASVQVVVPTAIRGDLDGNGRVDLYDLARLLTWLDTPAASPNDARDLNGDGLINDLDARILITLCTYPRCATHP